MKPFFALLLVTVTCTMADRPVMAQADKLKIKARQVTQQPLTERRTPAQVITISDRTAMVMIDNYDGTLIRDQAKSVPRFELYDRGKFTLLRGQDPVARVKAGDLFVDRLVHFQGDAIMLAVRRDTVKGAVELYWQKLDPNLTKPHAHFIHLATFETRTFGKGDKMGARGGYHDRFETALSPDGSLMLIYSAGIEDNEGKIHRPMILVGEHMQERWKHTFSAKADEPLRAVQLDDSGVAYLLERVRVKPEDKKDTTRHAMRFIRLDGGGLTEAGSGLAKGHWIKSAVLKPWADGRIICAGIHGGLNPKGEPFLGEFTGLVKADGDVLENVVQRPFAFDANDALPTKNGLRFVDVLPSGDGGLFLVREHFLETDAVDAKTSMSGLRWIHGPVDVTRRDASGADSWSTTFRRLYYTTNKEAGNVLSTVHKGELLLFVLDSDLLAERRKKDDRKMLHTDGKSPYSAYVHFSGDGAYRSKSILNGSDGTSYLIGDRFWELKPGDLIGLGAPKAGGKNAGLARIELTE